MRYAAKLGIAALVTVSCAPGPSPSTPSPAHPAERLLRSPEGEQRNPFCFVDLRTVRCQDLEQYPPEAVDRIETVEGAAAVERYGPDAADGAVLVSTTPSADIRRPPAEPAGNVFYFIDGRTATRSDLEEMPPDRIDGIEVLRGAGAIARFGADASDGVVIVKTKDTRGMGAPSSPAPRANRTDVEGQADFKSLLAEVASRQRVDVVWTGGPYRYAYDWGGGSAADPAEADVARVTAALARELRQYPDGFLRRAGVEGIVLVRDLFVEEDGGARGAAAYVFENRLFLDVPLADRAVQAGTRVRFIHHLIWHWLDERAGTMWQDPEWEALNPPGFEYGVYSRGGVHETRAGSGSLTMDYPGFLNLYSTGNLPDDKAEVYAYLMVIHSWLAERSRQDPFLRGKVAVIKARLAALDPGFDDDFWNRIHADSDDAARYGPRQ
jgi:hypothetical protein